MWLILGGEPGSGLKERSKGHACGSDGRYRRGLISSLYVGRRYPAVESSKARVVANPSRIALWAPILQSWVHWKMWSPNGSMLRPHGCSGVSDGLNSGGRSLHLRLHVKIQGASLFDGMLRQRETRGYTVLGDRRLGSRWRCWGSLVQMSWWSSVQRQLLKCSLMQLHALFGDTEERKCVILSGGDDVKGAHATDAICGSR